MSEHHKGAGEKPSTPRPPFPEDLQEATFAAMRRVLEEAKAALVLGRITNLVESVNDSMAGAIRMINEVLAGEPGTIFLAQLRRLEADGAAFRVALGTLRYCAHGCSGDCPHTRLFRQAMDSLRLHGIDPESIVQSSARPAWRG